MRFTVIHNPVGKNALLQTVFLAILPTGKYHDRKKYKMIERTHSVEFLFRFAVALVGYLKVKLLLNGKKS